MQPLSRQKTTIVPAWTFTGLRLPGRRLLLPATVAAEPGYLIDRLGGPADEATFLVGVAEGGFEPVELTTADYRRMAELVEQYDDMRLGTTDASVIALARAFGHHRDRHARPSALHRSSASSRRGVHAAPREALSLRC